MAHAPLGDLERRLRAEPGLARKAQIVVEAARIADLGALQALLARGADLNASWRNYRPLHALIQEKPHAPGAPDEEGGLDPARLACLDWLLANGADPEALGAWPSMRALLVAAFTGIPEYVETLRAAGARMDLAAQAALGELAAVRKALARDPSLARRGDESGLTPLHACAGSRLFANDPRGAKRLRDIAALLLDAHADPNARVRSWGHDVDVAYFALGARHVELFELLLERGADATSALASAAWTADTRFAEVALARGADPDRARQEGRPILNELVRWGQVVPALWLLEHGASPNLPDERGWTALHQAASRGNERMLRALLAKGGDASLRDSEGLTPLDVARSRGRPALVELLSGGPPPAPKPRRPRRKA